MKALPIIRNMALAMMLAGSAFAQPTFYNKIPIPPLLEPVNDTIKLEMRVKRHKFNPGAPSDLPLNGNSNQPNGLISFCYNKAGSSDMTVLGPTLHWYKGKNANIQVTNLIGQVTTTHWHGVQLPAMMDGGPHQMIDPGKTWKPSFEVLDGAATMWYHPHLHDKTVQQVQAGLAGMIIIDDPNDPIRETLPHTYGVDDIPVIINDLSTSLDKIYDVYQVDTFQSSRPINLVNGVTNPYVEVPAHFVRLRILNGSSRKGMVFGLSKFNNTDTSLANLQNFYLVASDGGYTLKPELMKVLRNSSGERDEIVLDLSAYMPGDSLFLRNLKKYMPGSIVGSTLSPPSPPDNLPSSGKGKDATKGESFLKLRIVADPPGYTPVTAFTPFTTTWPEGLADTSNVVAHRLKRLVMHYDSTIFHVTPTLDSIKYNKVAFTIDSTTYSEERIDDTICVNTKEIWTIHNISTIAHPFHIHKVQFRILDVVDKNGNYLNLESLGFNGPKDDVLVMPGWKLRFLAKFDLYPTMIDHKETYMYHCHIVHHEDAIGGGMMHQFVVTDVAPCHDVMMGISTESERPTMALFPNPAEGTLHLKGQSAKPSTVSIMDLQGRRIREQQLPTFEGDAAINIEGLPNGLYLVEWRTHKGAVTGKLVVQR